nr:hypothetical protein [Phenylobacterium sp.]
MPALRIAAAAVLTLAMTAPAFAQQGGRPLTAHLTGAAQQPGAGDPDGTGQATVRVNVGKSQVCYDLTAEKIAPATAAHIHKAPPGAAGPPVVPLKPPGADGKSSGCVTVAADLAKNILQDPGAYYVNVHNAEFPAGAIRGQLSK